MILDCFSKLVQSQIFDWLPDIYSINSFDCARRSMGTVTVEIDCFVRVPTLILSTKIEEKIYLLEAQLDMISRSLNSLIKITYIKVWDLGDVNDAWDCAPPLKHKLLKLDTNGHPSAILYEFQMSQNDKSRMISNMIAYHYSGTKTVRIAPAVKNTLCIARQVSRSDFERLCPVTSSKKIQIGKRRILLIDAIFKKANSRIDLTISEFLKHMNNQYKANKTHTTASLEWWANTFNIDISNIKKENLDDAADAFIQILGALRKRLF